MRIFDTEGWYLDSVNLESDLKEFPYEEVFSSVSEKIIHVYNIILYMFINVALVYYYLG